MFIHNIHMIRNLFFVCAVDVRGVLDDLLHSDDEASSMCTSNPAQTNTGPTGSFLHFTKSVFNNSLIQLSYEQKWHENSVRVC